MHRPAQPHLNIFLMAAGLGAALGYPLGGVQGAILGLLVGLLIVFPFGMGIAWIAIAVDHALRWMVGSGRTTDPSLTLIDVCKTPSRRELAERFSIASRLDRQYEPHSEERQALAAVTRLYRERRTEEAGLQLAELRAAYPASPYIAARQARILLQELRCDEAAEIVRAAIIDHPEEISLLILAAGVAAVESAADQQARVDEVQQVLGRMVDWAGIQVDLIFRENRPD